MAIDGTLPLIWVADSENFTAANTTQARILIDVKPPQVLPAISGETALPGESAVRQRVLLGGCRVIDGIITSGDTVAKQINFYIGTLKTSYADMGTVTITATTNSTITRTVGSFISDDYEVGDMIMVFGSAGAANNGMWAQVTSVTDTVLTVNGVTALSVAGTQGAGFRIFAVGLSVVRNVPIGAGTNGTTASVAMLGGSLDPRLDNSPYGLMLGSNNILIAGMAATISALPATVTVTVHYGLY